MLNKLDEFEDAVRKAVSDVRLDNDVVVSVFETNIRVLGYETMSRFLSSTCVFPHEVSTLLHRLVSQRAPGSPRDGRPAA